MRENDVVAIGQEDYTTDIEFVTKSLIMVLSVGIGTPKLGGLRGGEEGAMAFEFEVKGKEDGLHVGKDRTKHEKPHVDKVWDKAVIRNTAQGVIQGDEACGEKGAKVFEQGGGNTLYDAAFDVDGNKAIEVFDWNTEFLKFKDDEEFGFEEVPSIFRAHVVEAERLETGA